MLRKPASSVIFIEDSMENEFLLLTENNWLKKSILKTMSDLKENIFCGKNIAKRLIPIYYAKKYGINNAWWYPLPNGWRLIYSILTPSKTEIIAGILEFMNHKNYERRFSY